MSEPMISLQQADESDFSDVHTLLERNDLPSEDVRSKPSCFYVGYDGTDRIAVGIVERYGLDGLLGWSSSNSRFEVRASEGHSVLGWKNERPQTG